MTPLVTSRKGMGRRDSRFLLACRGASTRRKVSKFEEEMIQSLSLELYKLAS